MTQFLVNCEVEAHISLTKEIPVLRYDNPAGAYTVFLRDLRVEPGSDPPLLSVQMTFGALSLREAKAVAQGHLKEFLDYLTLVTTSKFRLHRILQVFNWEPGNAERECIYYAGVANHDVPIPALERSLLETIALMQQEATPPLLRRALKWFGNGVASIYPDDQFTYFWFVIEVLAQVVKDPAPVPDRCPTCRGPLYCATCETTPLHRPYPKQAIQQLFQKYGGPNWEQFYGLASDVRNRLMHGDETAAIESALNIELPKMVDHLGHLAWIVILNQFANVFREDGRSLLQTERYVHLNLSTGAHMTVGFRPNFDDPDPGHFPKIDVSIKLGPESEPPSEGRGEG